MTYAGDGVGGVQAVYGSDNLGAGYGRMELWVKGEQCDRYLFRIFPDNEPPATGGLQPYFAPGDEPSSAGASIIANAGASGDTLPSGKEANCP